jgi:hypothetical protein
LEPAVGGASGAIFRGGEFMVRVERTDPERVRWQHALLRFLGEEIDQVVEPLVALDGSTFYVDGGRVISVFPFLEGAELRSQEALFRRELPTLLARLHRRAQAWPVTGQRPGVPSVRERNWDRNELRRKATTAGARVRAAARVGRDRRLAYLRDPRRPPYGKCRRARRTDCRHRRLATCAPRLAGARTGRDGLDLCWDGSSPTLDPALRDTVVRQYLDAGGPGEATAIVPLMRLESLVSALIQLTRAAQGQSWNREFTRLVVATPDELA